MEKVTEFLPHFRHDAVALNIGPPVAHNRRMLRILRHSGQAFCGVGLRIIVLVWLERSNVRHQLLLVMLSAPKAANLSVPGYSASLEREPSYQKEGNVLGLNP